MANEIKQNPDFNEEEGVAVKEEEEAPLESATDESQQEEPKEEAPEVQPEEDTKAVEGLTSELDKLRSQNAVKEKELRGQVSEQRSRRRELRRQERESSEKEEPKDPVDDLSDIDEESRSAVERLLKAGGYVKREEMASINFENTFKVSEDAFFKTHKEYLPDNDADDVLYDALQDEVSKYAKPKDPVQIAKLFENAHIIVQARFPSRFSEPEPQSNRAEVAALSGGRAGVVSTPKAKKSLTKEQVEKFRQMGWNDEDIKELI